MCQHARMEPTVSSAATSSLAKAAYNATWDLLESEPWSDEDRRQLLVLAMGSRHLWECSGDSCGPEQRFAGDWLISHVASRIGEASLALRFAQAAHARVVAQGWEGWQLASAEEGLARACAALGDLVGRDLHAQRCRVLLATLSPEDRDVIEPQLASIPGLEPS